MAYYLHHYFTPDFNHKHLRPVPLADGNVDAFNLGYVQNVVAGQVLADLTPLPENNADADVVFDQDTLDFFDSLPPSGPTGRRSTSSADASEDAPAEEREEAANSGADARFHSLSPARTIPEDAAEVISSTLELDIPGEAKLDPRYIYDTPVFPMGPNCGRDPENPNRIVAEATGYCFYNEGLITVKKLLNVRQPVNFATGNILFAGDIVAHEDIFPGFHLCGNDILIKGRIDGAFIRARGSITCESGIKGAPTATMDAEGTIRLAFCESAVIKTDGNLVIEGNCLHSTIYAGGSVIIKGRLQGGMIHAGNIVYAREQIGDAQGAVTRITLGYNPIRLLCKQETEAEIKVQSERKAGYERRSRRGPLFAEECAPLIELAARKVDLLQARLSRARKELIVDQSQAEKCRVVVPGTVHSGTEIRIGKAYFKVVDAYSNCHFRLREDEIDVAYPAISPKAEARLIGYGES